MRNLRLLLALGALGLIALVVSACGSGVPGDAVARVGDQSITRAQFTHWLKVAAVSSQPATPGKTPVVPDPPDYTSCVQQLRKTQKPARGQPKPSTAQLRTQCAQQYAGLRDQVLQFLISADWIQGEAADQGVSVSDKDVQKQFQQTKKQNFPKQSDFDKFLKQSGMTTDDLLFRIRLNLLSNKLRTKVTKGSDKVTKQQIAQYYAKNKSRFGQPQRRDLRVVLTKTRAQAEQAARELSSGQSFASVAKKLSIDPASKNQGGKLLGVAPGQEEPSLNTAIFKAPVGKLEGPVKTQFGWYVFKVTKTTPASQQSLAQATPTIKAILISQQQQNALNTFVKKFQKKWTDKTDCRQGFVTQSCSNAPKPKKSSTTTTTTQGG